VKSFDLKKLKERASTINQCLMALKKAWVTKLNFLSELISRFGLSGFYHWLKVQHQIESRIKAVNALLIVSKTDSFNLLQVEKVLNQFILPKVDMAQVEWYKLAHEYLVAFEKKLRQDSVFDLAELQSAQKELKFISQIQADEFHLHYKIDAIQQKVSKMYQALQKVIIDYKTIQLEKIQLHKLNAKIRVDGDSAEKTPLKLKSISEEAAKIKQQKTILMQEKEKLIAEKTRLKAKNIQQMKLSKQHEKQIAYSKLEFEKKFAALKVDQILKRLTLKLKSGNVAESEKQAISQFVDQIKIQL